MGLAIDTGGPALFGGQAGLGFDLLEDEEVQRLPRRSLRPRGELHSLMELDGGRGSVVQTKFPELLFFYCQTFCLGLCSIPILGSAPPVVTPRT